MAKNLNPKTISWSEFTARQKAEKSKSEIKIKEEPEYKKKERGIKYSIKDGFFASIKSGFTSNFVMPFAIALNATTGILAMLTALPQLVPSFLQLFSENSLKIFKTRNSLIFWTAFIQAFMWLPLIFIPMIAKGNINLALILLVLFVTLEGTLGTFQGPIYNSILGDIVDEDKRGEFFGKRNRVVNLVGFVATFIAGLVLTFFKNFDNNGVTHYVFFGFAILFLIAFVCRLLSAFYKTKIYAPLYTPKKSNVKLWDFFKNMTNNNYGIFVLYVLMFQLVANISAPFFALYLLQGMKMSYLYFTLILGSSILSGFVAMGYWGKLIDKRGSKFVLTICGFLVPFSPFLLFLAIFIKSPLWLFIYVLVEEAFSGVVWSGFNLSASAFLFDATSKEERVKYISYYNFLTGTAIFIGAMFGALLIKIYPTWIIAATAVASAIPIIYLTTGTLRLLVTSLMIKKVREARMVEIDFPGRGFFHSTVLVSPHYGSTVNIIGVYHGKDQQKDFHRVLVKKKTQVNPVKKEEKKLYEKKSFEYYRDNAMKTMGQRDKLLTQKDDSAKIAKNIEQEKKNISDLTEKIQKDRLKK